MIPDAWQFYLATLITLYCIALIAALGLDLQFGTTGILNFGYAISIGVGGYVTALLTLGPPEGTFQTYAFGLGLPFPVPWFAAAAAGAFVSWALGALVLGRLRGDYQAIVLLAISIIATEVVENQRWLVNGGAGLANIPQPLRDLTPDALSHGWLYAALAIGLAAGAVIISRRIVRSPLGRSLRAIRDDPAVAAALGKDVRGSQLRVMLVGGAAAGLSGAMTAQFLTGWNPESWLLLITFTYFTGIILGGSGNPFGVALGVALIPIGFREATRFLPPIGYPGLVPALQWVVIGLLALAVLWLRPNGILPERTVRFHRTGRVSRGDRLANAHPRRSPVETEPTG
jgi:branched-chain amino acid transport system permease protein